MHITHIQKAIGQFWFTQDMSSPSPQLAHAIWTGPTGQAMTPSWGKEGVKAWGYDPTPLGILAQFLFLK